MSTDWRFHFLQTAAPKTEAPGLIGNEQQARCEEIGMTEFENLLRELAKVDRDITAHFDAHPETRGAPLEGLSAEVRAEWTNLIQRKYLALDAVAAIAVKKYANEQL